MSKHIENYGEYSVKKIKSFMGQDTLGFNANLYRGKKKVAECVDDGGGGEVNIYWIDKSEQLVLDSHCKSLPQLDTEFQTKEKTPMTLTVDPELFVSELVGKAERERDANKMRKQCLTKTLYRGSKMGYGKYIILSSAYEPKVKDNLKKKYGDDVEIFNEVFALGGIPSVLEAE